MRAVRAVVALVLLAAAVAAGAFFAGHAGHVEIVWQGWQVDTSVAVLAGAVVFVVVAVSALALLAAALRRLPRNRRRRRAARRRLAGDRALTSGVVALSAGQPAQARAHAKRAVALLDGAPMALLLAAEAATQEGDAPAARQAYAALLDRPETEFLGLRGLIGQALRERDDGTALRLAERARLLRPDGRWLTDGLLLLQARAGDWQKARDTLVRAARRSVLPAERARHHRGVVLYELSREAERSGYAGRAAALAAQAQALAPDVAAVAALHARLLLELGRKRAAKRAIERAWRGAAHPDLARLYLDIEPASGPLARAASLQRLAAQNPEAAESHLAIAEAALAAQLWGEARHHLALAGAAPSTGEAPGGSRSGAPGPSRRLSLLMARLEESGGGDAAAARAWLARAIDAPPDPAYCCSRCGGESAEWHSLCGNCGSLDTLAWRSPPHRDRAIGVIPATAGATVGAPTILMMPDGPGPPPPNRVAPPTRVAPPSRLAPNRLAPTGQSDN